MTPVSMPIYQPCMPEKLIGVGEEWGRNLGDVGAALLSTAYWCLWLGTISRSGRVGNTVAVALLLLATACNGPGPPESSTNFGHDAMSSTTSVQAQGPARANTDLGSTESKGELQGSLQQNLGSSVTENAPRLPPPARLKPRTRLTQGTTIRVGPDRLYRKPSEAARIAKDGDTIEIDSAVYVGDVAAWRQNNLTLKGVGGRAHIRAAGQSVEGKAIWVIKGDNTTVENLEFSGTKVGDKNGAGIRLEGMDLVIRNSSFHDNEMGILTGRNPDSDVTIEYSEFYGNTVDYRKTGRLGHNIYIGEIRSFTLTGSYVHGAIIGHNVKSRARYNTIQYNRIMDENDGGSSYLIDLPNGGTSYLIGNLFHQSPKNDNNTMISYGSEGHKYDERTVYVLSNTFVNDDKDGAFIQTLGKARVRALNNLFVGPGQVVRSKDGLLEERVLTGNVVTANPEFVDRESFDYRLRSGSPAIDQGIDAGSIQAFDLRPRAVYIDPVQTTPRRPNGALDSGAYEFEGE